jgi:gliding motility-associated-like protein
MDDYCQSDPNTTPAIITITPDTTGVFSITPGITFVNNKTGEIDISRSIPGQYLIRFGLGGICEEEAKDTININSVDNPDFVYGNNGAICYSENDSSYTPLSIATPGGLFTARPDSINAPDTLFFKNDTTGAINVAISDPGDYRVTYTTGGQCPDDTTKLVRLNDKPEVGTINVEPGLAVCDSELVNFSLLGNPGGSVSYYLNNNFQIQSSVWDFDGFVENDTVSVVVENIFGCSDTAFVVMTITPKPVMQYQQPLRTVLTGADPISIGVGTDLDLTSITWTALTGDSISVDSVSGVTGLLNAFEFETLTNIIHLQSDYIPDSIVYIFLPESRGCVGAFDTIVFNVNPNQFPIFVPEVFTPDGNGFNDTWKIQWRSDLNAADYLIDVYNPSGGRVYQMTPIKSDWNGENLPDGVYWWVLKNITTSEVVLAGGVTIRRR